MLLNFYLLYFGISKYKEFQLEKRNFLDYERYSVLQYLTYEQYGSYGFRVMWEPSPLVVFNHSSLRFVQSLVDVKDVVNVSAIYKGRMLFTDTGSVADFCTSFYLLGSLLMIYFGLSLFSSLSAIVFSNSFNQVISSICSRLLILNIFFVSALFISYYFVRLHSINIVGGDLHVFIKYSLFLIVILNLFFFFGLLISVLINFKKLYIISAYLIWFLIIFVIPLGQRIDLEKQSKAIKSNEIVNIFKLKNSRKFERRTKAFFDKLQEKKVKEIMTIARQFINQYLENTMPLNNNIENSLNREVNKLIEYYEDKSILSPSTFYNFLTKECSGLGYHGYQDFIRYIMQIKLDFTHYYFKMRYDQIDQNVVSFVKDKENIFVSRSRLPVNFSKGVLVTILYTLLFFLGSLLILRRRLTRHKASEPIPIDTERMVMSKTYFYLDDDSGQKHGIIAYLKLKGALVVPAPDPAHYDLGTSLKSWLIFQMKQKHIPRQKLWDMLETLGITSSVLKRKIKDVDREVFMGAFLALHLAQEATLYVFDDYLNRVSREFEQRFKQVIDIHMLHSVIIYISGQMFDLTAKGKPTIPEKDYRFVAVDLQNISLR
jgi:hypothetical protein